MFSSNSLYGNFIDHNGIYLLSGNVTLLSYPCPVVVPIVLLLLFYCCLVIILMLSNNHPATLFCHPVVVLPLSCHGSVFILTLSCYCPLVVLLSPHHPIVIGLLSRCCSIVALLLSHCHALVMLLCYWCYNIAMLLLCCQRFVVVLLLHCSCSITCSYCFALQLFCCICDLVFSIFIDWLMPSLSLLKSSYSATIFNYLMSHTRALSCAYNT